MRVLNTEEYNCLQQLKRNDRYITRDGRQQLLNAFKDEPTKDFTDEVWIDPDNQDYNRTPIFTGEELFDFIKWDNDHPYLIDELLEYTHTKMKVGEEMGLPEKPSIKQLVEITAIEKMLDIRFKGKTYQDAVEFIIANHDEYIEQYNLEMEQALELSDSMRKEIENDKL